MADARDFNLLTARERECLRLVHDRLQTKEIARLLAISPATVDSHLNNAIRKLAVSGRRDAAMALFAHEHSTMEALHNDYGPRSAGIPKERGLGDADDVSNKGGFPGTGPGDGGRFPPDKHRPPPGSGGPPPRGMGAVIIRYALDALFVGFFFVVTTGFAIGLHLLVYWCESIHLSPHAVSILKAMELAVLAIDAIGVVFACAFLTYRFLRALMHAE